MVVGRAGIGLDNVDVTAATERGVMVVNAPPVQHPLGGRAHDGPAAWPRPATSPRPTPRWSRAAGSGPAGRGSSCPTRPSAWSASAASASWWPSGRTPSACGWWRTTRSCPRTGPASWAWSRSTSTAWSRSADFVTLHVAKTPGDGRPHRQGPAGPAKPGIRIINVARGGIVDEAALAEAVASATSAGRPSTCSPPSPPPTHRCSGCPRSWSRPTSAPAPGRRRTRRATPSPSRWPWPWPASSCPSRST